MALKFPDAKQVVAEHNALLLEKHLEPKIDLIVGALRQYGTAHVFFYRKLYLSEVDKECVRIETTDPRTAAHLVADAAEAAGYTIYLGVTYTNGSAAFVLHLPSNTELD